MGQLSRRSFIRAAAGLAAVSLGACARIERRSKGPRVVVVGGSFGGATTAKYIRLLDPSVQVVLIERDRKLVTGPFSNAVIADLQQFDTITQDYRRISLNHAVDVINAEVESIDPAQRVVTLATGDRVVYDRLVLAPGCDMRWGAIAGYDEAASLSMPHAWRGGEQVKLLHRQLEAMSDGGLAVIAAPADAISHPLAVYERASLMAHYLKRNKPRSKVLILDGKDTMPLQQLLTEAWNTLYPGLIEWVPASKGGRVTAVELAAGKLVTDAGSHRPAVANVIPPQQAGVLAARAGLVDATGWCPVDPRTFESTRVAGIHVVGDAARAGQLPKSAHAANAEAKVCAQALVDLLRGVTPQEPSLLIASYSLLGKDYGISEVARYRATNGELTQIPGSGGVSALGASAGLREQEADFARGWYRNLTMDSFA